MSTLQKTLSVGDEITIDGNVHLRFVGWTNESKTSIRLAIDAPREVPITWPGKDEPRGGRGMAAAVARVRERKEIAR